MKTLFVIIAFLFTNHLSAATGFSGLNTELLIIYGLFIALILLFLTIDNLLKMLKNYLHKLAEEGKMHELQMHELDLEQKID